MIVSSATDDGTTKNAPTWRVWLGKKSNERSSLAASSIFATGSYHTSAKFSFLMSLWTHFCGKNTQDGLMYRMVSLFICKFPGSEVIL